MRVAEIPLKPTFVSVAWRADFSLLPEAFKMEWLRLAIPHGGLVVHRTVGLFT